MFKKVQMIAALAAAVVVMSSCALTTPVSATGNAIGSKTGTAKATGYLGVLYFNGDASMTTAAKNGGIKKISTVDVKRTSILGIIVTTETTVTGE